jgi:hypothetical protein
MRSLVYLTALLSLTTLPAHAFDLYSEDFDGQEGLGATHLGVDTTGANWTINPGDASLFDSGDYIKVSGGRLTARDTNGGCLSSFCSTGGASFSEMKLPTWLSPIINVSGWTDLRLSLDAAGSGWFEVGGGFNSEDDYIVSYFLDGVEMLVADLVQSPTFGNQTVTATIADGNELQIAIKMNNYAAAESFYLDNVNVSGNQKDVAKTPEPSLVLAFAGLALIRRRLS